MSAASYIVSDETEALRTGRPQSKITSANGDGDSVTTEVLEVEDKSECPENPGVTEEIEDEDDEESQSEERPELVRRQ